MHGFYHKKQYVGNLFILAGLVIFIAFSGAACARKAQTDPGGPPAGKNTLSGSAPVQAYDSSGQQKALPKGGSGPSAVGEQAPAAAGNKAAFVFDVLGDSKILPGQDRWTGNRVLQAGVERINQDHPALVVYLGDGVDRGGPVQNFQSFRGYMDKLESPWYPAIGNHELLSGSRPDGQGATGEGNFRQALADKLPLGEASYYSFDYQNSHFVVLDTAWQSGGGPPDAELKPGSRQWEWLCQDLDKARPKSKHIFIFGHKPPVTPFRSGGPDTVSDLPDGYRSSWGSPGAAVAFMQLVANYRVDAVFSGHIHMYNRMAVNGTDYFITAGAGAQLYTTKDNGGFYHYLRCLVNGDQVQYEVVKLPGK